LTLEINTLVPAPQPRLNLLVLSPHRDDAAFSLALSLAAWRRAGHNVTILNAFTRSIDAPFSDADSLHENDRLSYVSAMRKREDEAFARLIPGLALVDANIKDAPLRRHCEPDVVYNIPLDPADGALVKIRKVLTRHLTLPNPAFVLPLALGNHIDHRVAREAAVSLVADLPCTFYEDLPDAFRDPTIPDQPGLTPIFTSNPNPLDWKRKAILLYSSQIETDTAARILDHARAHNDTERLWANPAFAHLFPSV
jgi:LmbE family N-acetylglucosaminyl deacetylase